jgi:hypothetical protein
VDSTVDIQETESAKSAESVDAECYCRVNPMMAAVQGKIHIKQLQEEVRECNTKIVQLSKI